jgi:hypothetical protein
MGLSGDKIQWNFWIPFSVVMLVLAAVIAWQVPADDGGRREHPRELSEAEKSANENMELRRAFKGTPVMNMIEEAERNAASDKQKAFDALVDKQIAEDNAAKKPPKRLKENAPSHISHR